MLVAGQRETVDGIERRLVRPHGNCHACHAETNANADTFCVPCWRVVTAAECERYLMLWRAGEPPALVAYVAQIVARVRLRRGTRLTGREPVGLSA